MSLRNLLLAAGGLGAAACGTSQRLAAPPTLDTAKPMGIAIDLRVGHFDSKEFAASSSEIAERVRRSSDGSIDILALSGGGGGGSFGAGVMLGLQKAGGRPRYEIVTGVSTGALIAPFVFLGPDWDDKLNEAYSGKATADLLQSRGLGVLFQPSVFDGEPLVELITRFVTDEMIDAVAREAAHGRLLLVATTNLDREETDYWNMGAIAQVGDEKARRLFRQVLVASASVPGVFPPVMIEVEQDGQTYHEMHVDGGATTSFFVMPDFAMITRAAPEALRGANLQIVINGQVSTAPRTTQYSSLDIVNRSFNAALNHLARVEVLQSEAFATRNHMTFAFTAIPDWVAFGGSLAFDEHQMKAMFDYGLRCGRMRSVWTRPAQGLEQAERYQRETREPMSPPQAACPAPPTKASPED